MGELFFLIGGNFILLYLALNRISNSIRLEQKKQTKILLSIEILLTDIYNEKQ